MAYASNPDHQRLFEQVKQCVFTQGQDRIAGASADQLAHTIEHKLANLQPSIMLYGIYNAGKSTLINALFGTETAAVSDRPETATIHPYDWQGYRIFDTPGVDAPAEHQQITEEHLKSVEVVIFVMSTNGAFDEVGIYKRLVQVVLNQKHLVIVLNDKTGTDDSNKHAILSQVNKNLIIALGKNNQALIEKIPVVFLNARTALKGRLEQKKLLVQKSNITQLEAVIQQKMAQTSVYDSIKALAKICQPVLADLSAVIDGELAQSSENALMEQIKDAELVRINLEMQVERSIAQYMPQMQDSIRDVLYDGEDDANTLQLSIMRMTDQYSSKVLQHYQNSIAQYADDMGKHTHAHEVQIFGLADHVQVSNAKHQAAQQVESVQADVVGQVLTTMIDSKTGGLGAMLMGALKDNVLGGFSKDKTSEWGGFMNFLSGSNESVVRSHLLSANQQAGQIRHQTETGLYDQLMMYATKIADDLEQPLREKRHVLDDKSQKLLQEMEMVHGLQGQLSALILG